MIAVETDHTPADLLATVKRIEQDFGRRRGRRWTARVLDLDLIAAEGIIVNERRRGGHHHLTIPHPALPQRGFVLDPLVDIAPQWRHPRLNLTARQLRQRHLRPRRSGAASP